VDTREFLEVKTSMPTTASLVKTHVEYELMDWRFPKPGFFKRIRGEDASLYLFRGGWTFLGLGGRLWRLDKIFGWGRFREDPFIPDPDWFSKLSKPLLEISMARVYGNEFSFQCIVFETDERFQCIAFETDVRIERHVQRGRLENVTHNLVRIQRWTKRILRRARVRLVLLMALHPRLGAKAGIAELGPDLILALTLF
jgi:hypothetical protein